MHMYPLTKYILTASFLFVYLLSHAQSPSPSKGGDKPYAVYKNGSVKISVWLNKTADGRNWKNFKIENLYKKEDKWESTQYYGSKDLMELQEVLKKVLEAEVNTDSTAIDKPKK